MSTWGSDRDHGQSKAVADTHGRLRRTSVVPGGRLGLDGELPKATRTVG